MMKKIMRIGISAALVLIMAFGLWGCAAPQEVSGSAFAEMVKTLDASQFTCLDGAGNISAEEFVNALKIAAAGDYTLEENVEDGYDPQAGYSWSMEAYFEGDLETIGISWNDLHIRAECYFTENLVKVWYGKAGVYDTATFHDEALYQLIRHKGDRENRIDEAAYEEFKDILTEQMESHYNGWKDSPGEITGYELLDFYPVGSYEEDDATVELYEFDYALLPEKPEEVILAGGTCFDSKLRLVGFNGGGQLAVRYRNGDMAAHAFMGNDFYYVPGGEEYFEGYEKQQKDRLKSELDDAEKN